MCIYGKSWPLHVLHVLETTLEENLAMIRDSVAFLRSEGKEVIYDAEHFFDGYRADREYALATLQAAAQAGAEWVVLCDTNGGSLPGFVTEVVGDGPQRDPDAGWESTPTTTPTWRWPTPWPRWRRAAPRCRGP